MEAPSSQGWVLTAASPAQPSPDAGEGQGADATPRPLVDFARRNVRSGSQPLCGFPTSYTNHLWGVF
jgi:hypothetical protein